MKISVFGLGYVGIVSAACFAQEGHQVIGVDVSPDKVAMVNQGKSPIVEKDIGEIVARGVAEGRLRATNDAAEGILNSDLSLICVGTPSRDNGSLDLTYVERVCADIGRGIALKDSFHTVVLRSTVLPGTTETCALPILEQASGRAAGETFGLCFNPEFLREGTSVYDFYHPPFTIIGELHPQATQMLTQLYAHLDAPLFTTPVKTAEMMKYVNNAFHALKVVFANEVGSICKQVGVDSHVLMDMFCLDTKLNLSPYYLKPGFAFGGSCLPKDLRALLHFTQRLDQSLPLLESLLPSNEVQVKRGFDLIRQTGGKKIGILGFSFKAGTDDLRESPLVTLVEMLIGKGYAVKIYDKNVSLAYLSGANRAYIERTIPHIANLMCNTSTEVMTDSEVIVIGNKSPEFADIAAQARPEQTVIDLVRVAKELPRMKANYVGIGW